MVDPDGWLKSATVGDALKQCEVQLLKSYQDLDLEAKRLQHTHLRDTLWVAVLALLAILIALLESRFPILWLSFLELGAGGAAAVVAFLGIRTARQREWLVHRHKAERLRYAKFHFLTSADLWRRDRKYLADKELDDEIGRIDRLDIGRVRSWAEKDEAPRGPDIASTAALNPDAIRELRDYYHDIRFKAQLNYLGQKGRAPSALQEAFQHLPQALFFATAAIILLHFALEVGPQAWMRIRGTGDDTDPRGTLLPILVLCAVLLPALGAMFRTIAMASEMGRNSRRSSAKHEALFAMAEPLRTDEDPPKILRNLWVCEYVIESDHREWLRLMVDAHWFG